MGYPRQLVSVLI